MIQLYPLLSNFIQLYPTWSNFIHYYPTLSNFIQHDPTMPMVFGFIHESCMLLGKPRKKSRETTDIVSSSRSSSPPLWKPPEAGTDTDPERFRNKTTPLRSAEVKRSSASTRFRNMRHWHGFSRWEMDQYLWKYTSYLGGWTSILTQLFWCEQKRGTIGFDTLSDVERGKS